MYKKVLVEPEIQEGERLLDTLDRRNFPITAAFWLYADDADEWRLVIVSELVATLGPREAYKMVAGARAGANGPVEIPLERIYLLTPSDLRYKQVRLASIGGSAGLAVAKGALRSVAMEDAYVYRMN